MKKKLLLMMGLFITLGTQAQINEKVYFTAEQMPDMMVFILWTSRQHFYGFRIRCEPILLGQGDA